MLFETERRKSLLLYKSEPSAVYIIAFIKPVFVYCLFPKHICSGTFKQLILLYIHSCSAIDYRFSIHIMCGDE